MQTPWSHQAVREEFDEEIRLLILALYEAAADETKGQMHVEDDEPSALSHAHQLTLWSLAVLYAPWMATPLDPSKLITQAKRHFDALHRQRAQHAAANSTLEESARAELELLNALACAATAGVPGARDDLDECLAEHDQRWWEARYGLVKEQPRRRNDAPAPSNVNLTSNVEAIGTYLLLSEITEDRIWADRARSIALALHRALPPEKLASTIALARATGEENDGLKTTEAAKNTALPLSPALKNDEATATYFLWVRNLLHLRANLVESGDEAPEWMLNSAWDLYRWVRSISWREDGRGFCPSCLREVTPDDSGYPFVPLTAAVSATEALGKTLEHIGGNDEWLAQLSEDFAISMTWADRHLRQAPGQWGPDRPTRSGGDTGGEAAKTSSCELSEALLSLATPLMLVRLPLSPTIPTALAQGCVAPWKANGTQG